MKQHISYTLGLCALLIMIGIQWQVQYDQFDWRLLWVTLLQSLVFYSISSSIARYTIGNKPYLHPIFYYALRWMAFIILTLYFVNHSGVDLPLVPHPLVDTYLAHIDAFLYFNVADVMTYCHTHLPSITKFFYWIYDSLGIASAITLLVLPCLSWKSFERLMFLFFTLMAMTLVFCYFFPAIGPVSYYTHIQFPEFTETLATHFVKFRSYTSDIHISASVTCPSWHVIIALLIMVGFWPIKRFYLRYLGILYAGLISISIFVTGWHYLADLLASLLFMLIALYIAKKAIGKGG